MRATKQEIALFEQVLGKYNFVQPFSRDDRRSLIMARKEILIRVLKTVGAYTALYAIYLFFRFLWKKIIAGITLTKVIVSAIIVAMLAAGGYFLNQYITRAKIEEQKKREAALKKKREREEAEKRKRDFVTHQIILYDGRVLRGAVISRGAMYTIQTARGIMRIPRDKIRMIRPLR